MNALQSEIVHCRRCPRLREHCARSRRGQAAGLSRLGLLGKPVPSFGDPQARILILGLAPGAHGSNRTGRMFTGDRSGDMLYGALHKTGFASQPASRLARRRPDAARRLHHRRGRCAPPGNKPPPEEIRNCRPYLERELDLLAELQRGGGAGQDRLRRLPGRAESAGRDSRAARAFAFGHNRAVPIGAGAAGADQLLSPQPAEHLHRQADREDAAGCLPRARA